MSSLDRYSFVVEYMCFDKLNTCGRFSHGFGYDYVLGLGRLGYVINFWVALVMGRSGRLPF